jgi:hypothetical protein
MLTFVEWTEQISEASGWADFHALFTSIRQRLNEARDRARSPEEDFARSANETLAVSLRNLLSKGVFQGPAQQEAERIVAQPGGTHFSGDSFGKLLLRMAGARVKGHDIYEVATQILGQLWMRFLNDKQLQPNTDWFTQIGNANPSLGIAGTLENNARLYSRLNMSTGDVLGSHETGRGANRTISTGPTAISQVGDKPSKYKQDFEDYQSREADPQEAGEWTMIRDAVIQEIRRRMEAAERMGEKPGDLMLRRIAMKIAEHQMGKEDYDAPEGTLYSMPDAMKSVVQEDPKWEKELFPLGMPTGIPEEKELDKQKMLASVANGGKSQKIKAFIKEAKDAVFSKLPEDHPVRMHLNNLGQMEHREFKFITMQEWLYTRRI